MIEVIKHIRFIVLLSIIFVAWLGVCVFLMFMAFIVFGYSLEK